MSSCMTIGLIVARLLRLVRAGLVILLGGFMLSCTPPKEFEPIYRQEPLEKKRVLRFAVHPLHNPEKLNVVFGPLIAYLNKKIPGANFTLEASTNYASFERKLQQRELDFALPNPYQTILSVKYGYRVFAKMGDDDRFRGLILVRKDSGIKKISDLRGTTISYPAPTALAATMLPQYFLFQQGLNILKETKSVYVGSQESSIMNVYLKNSQAGCTWPPPWQAFVQDNPDKAKELEIRWQTDSLPNNGLVVRDDVPEELTAKVRKSLLSLSDSEEGQRLLKGIGTSHFESADIHTFDPVVAFIKHFTKVLRVPEKEQ